ncbi:histone-like nucleoid-structuring protein MvaT [Pseudomonas sp. P8_250]|uniref:histone-like nucleoid-structuring protein MvaT n=1 Tax=Pseudomonas sp. P8_250 TaxID=3043446 RepID=UPI002A35EA09|nr:histone-like nucleoid-structuring protein MvaT [Pseudomonas sp. P8_250]MDX9668656.1 DNA binding protein [Pseudomonas sp. P8_250]
MSSLINEYRATEEAIKELQARLQNLSQDDKLQTELEFEGKLRTLMGEYNKSLRDVISIMDPDAKFNKAPKAGTAATGGKTRASRKVKQYKNPNNGEVIETKGGNHKTLKEWKEKWGSEEVESWVTLLD